MIFLIQYDRAGGRTVAIQRFDDIQRATAQSLRLQLEIDAKHAGLDHEVVILEAANEDVVRRTHRRYFESEKLKAEVEAVKIAGRSS